MFFEKARIISNEDSKYVILSVIMENNTEYAFANKLDNSTDTPTDEYCIFTVNESEINIIIDNNLINKLLPKFNKEIESVLGNIDKIWGEEHG